MTHSHDTSTPAMSDETVPSEEFVLVPRELTERMALAGESAASFGIGRPNDDEAIRRVWREMIAAAPTLSASHLAKEGGEAGAVEPIEKHRIANRLRGMFDMSVPSEGDFNRLTPAGFRLLRQAHDALIAPDEAVAAPASNPSPAAKGGEAVRAIANRYAERAGYKRDGEHSDMIVNAIAEALSTPTEGPASQTEGMGGDATKMRWFGAWLPNYLAEHDAHIAHCQSDEEREDQRAHSARDITNKARAALTPPETAEAVPVASFGALSALANELSWNHKTRAISDRIRAAIETDRAAAPVQPDPEAVPVTSDPAPATDDRERLVEALKSAAVSLEQAAGRFNLMGGVGLVNGADPKAGYAEAYEASCVARAALATEASR